MSVKKIIHAGVLLAGAAAVLIMGTVGYFAWALPDRYYVSSTGGFSLSQYRMLTVSCPGEAIPAVRPAEGAVSEEAELRLMGVVPVKKISLCRTEKKYLVPCGTPFGLKMLAAGVMVVGLSPVESFTGVVCPAQEAGIRKGDMLLAVNGKPISAFRELSEAVSSSAGAPVDLLAERDGKKIMLRVTPVQTVSDGYQCGLWGRDSSAGIGTVTYYDPATGYFGGLGHGVCDTDTGNLMPLSEGEVMPAVILDVVRGTAGEPGELRGSFAGGFASGILLENTPCGVFGILRNAPSRAVPVEICPFQEVQEGPAEMLSTLSGKEPAFYDIEIERVSGAGGHDVKNMVIRVTDPALLELSGGIVQGMSGSPIMQNGKLAGAVTHVFIDDPTRGYGIFIENMLEAAG